MGMEAVSAARGETAGVDVVRLFVESRRAQHHVRARQGRRQLPLESAHRRRGAASRVRRRHRACPGWHAERGLGRKPVPGQGRRAPHAWARPLGARRHHPRYGDEAGEANAVSRYARWPSPARCSIWRTKPFSPAPPSRSRRSPVDRLPVGTGKRGPITEALQTDFFGLFSGKTQDKWGWLDYVDMSPAARRGFQVEDTLREGLGAARGCYLNRRIRRRCSMWTCT